jgi:hypothetical protein
MHRPLIAVIILAVPCMALGQSGAARPADSATLMQRLDRNNDGFVTRDEAKDASELQGRFVELDTNNDNKISAREMQALDRERGAAGATAQEKKTASRPANRGKP